MHIIVFNTVAPFIVLISAGYLLRKAGISNRNYIDVSSSIVYKIALPVSLFYNTLYSEIDRDINEKTIWFLLLSAGAVAAAFLISFFLGKVFINEKSLRGVFVQGAFRSNYIIIGYPIVDSFTDNKMTLELTLLAIVIIPVLNILSVIALSVNNEKEKSVSPVNIAGNIFKNPIIHGIVLGYLANMLNIEFPEFMNRSMVLIKNITIPLALMGIGYLFSEKLDAGHKKILLAAVALKSLIFPVLLTSLAFLAGLDKYYLMIIFVLLASPTAINSFIMAKEMNGNEKLAANIVVFTTSVSVAVIYAGILFIETSNLY